MDLRADDCQDECSPWKVAVLVVGVDCTQCLTMTRATRATLRSGEICDGDEGAHEEKVQDHEPKMMSTSQRMALGWERVIPKGMTNSQRKIFGPPCFRRNCRIMAARV